MVEYKGLKVDLPKGSAKTQDFMSKVIFGIVIGVIVYILYEIYKGYEAIKDLPVEVLAIPTKLYETGKDLTFEGLMARGAELPTIERRFEELAPLEKGLVSLGNLVTLGEASALGLTAKTETVEALQTSGMTAYQAEQYLLSQSIPTQFFVNLGNLLTGGAATEAGIEFRSWYDSWSLW